MATEVGAGSKHTPADREYLDNLSARLLMEFRNYVFSPTYIALNAAKFLDHKWVDMRVLREFLQQPAQNPPPTRQFVSDLVRVKIEATPFLAPVPGPPILVKAEPQVADEGDREVFELFRIQNLRPTTRVKSGGDRGTPAYLSIVQRNRFAWCVEQVLGDNSDSVEPDARSESSDVMRG
ncbi:hypothetical protein DFH09DRAFT_1105431 [Mycena vulgaris]|nr:hypothetical protein DFH09DRAFT_1105431 [Mycena vulgaris]